jgi:hypothetical protein
MAKLCARDHAEDRRADYVARYNLRLHDKSFDPGDQVIVLTPDSDQKLYSRWVQAVVKQKLSPHSYVVTTEDGSERHLHANKLRLFKQRVNTVGIVFEGEEEFGNLVCAPRVLVKQETVPEQIWKLDHLSADEQQRMATLLSKHMCVCFPTNLGSVKLAGIRLFCMMVSFPNESRHIVFL